MKKLLNAVLVTGLVTSLLLGCNMLPQRRAYATLKSVHETTDSALKGFFLLVAVGEAKTNGVPQVANAYRDFQSAFTLAVELAQGDSNAVAPAVINLKSDGVLRAIAEAKGVR